ncbi:MAG TPA: TonB-dependent receptor, partial [Candidatus Binataceae bacterium]|nr:TonB-dependent receptor [Candidatus Binataceae bacterium]
MRIFLPAALAAFLSCFCPLNGQTQTSLTVHVTDPQRRAVPGATVSVSARDNSAQLIGATTADGLSRFSALAAGDYLVSAEARGFEAAQPLSIHVESGEQKQIDLPLTLAGVRTEVVVTAAGTPQTVDEVAKDVSTVDAQEMHNRDVFEAVNAIATLPGVFIEQEGGLEGFSAIRLRGLPDYDTSVLVDGLRLRDPTTPQGDAESLIQDLVVTDVDRFEVLEGAGSSLYGTNAVGGVVNMITNPGGGPTHGSILTEGGSLGTFRGRADLAGGLLDDRLEYSAGVSELDVTSGVGGVEPARVMTGQGRLSWRISPQTQAFARFYFADAFSLERDDPNASATAPTSGIVDAIANVTYTPAPSDPDNTLASRFYSGAAGITGHLTDDLGYSITYQGVGSWRRYANGPAGTGYQSDDNTSTGYYGTVHTVNAMATYQPGRHQLLDAGYEFEHEDFNSISLDALVPANNAIMNVTQQSNAVFAQDQVRLLGDRLQIAASVRAQYFTLSALDLIPITISPYASVHFPAPPAAYTGDGAIAYFFRGSGTKIRAHVGRGYRAPSLYERFGNYFYDGYYGFEGDPRLRPERSIGFDGGVDQTLGNNRARLSATYFYTRLQEVIDYDDGTVIMPSTDPFGRYGGYFNTSGGLSRGVEFSASVAATRSLDIRGAYTYTLAQERTPIVENIIQTFLAPHNMFALVATQRFGARLTAT